MILEGGDFSRLLEESKQVNIEFEKDFNMQKNINLLISEHCNLSCGHCSTGSPFAQKVYHPASSFFEWLDLLVQMQSPFKYVSLTGGEPFLHPEMRDGSMINELASRYPEMKLGLTTNFFWASEERIVKYAPMIRQLSGVLISVYQTILDKLGGRERYAELVRMLKNECPDVAISIEERVEFFAWDFHEDQREVKSVCGTHDCFTLYPSGRLSHCSVVVGAMNRSEYRPIVEKSREAFFELSDLPRIGMDQFLSWKAKYPFDTCLNCTMWEHKAQPWHLLSREDRTPVRPGLNRVRDQAAPAHPAPKADIEA